MLYFFLQLHKSKKIRKFFNNIAQRLPNILKILQTLSTRTTYLSSQWALKKTTIFIETTLRVRKIWTIYLKMVFEI